MDVPPPTWVDRTEEIALPLYAFALGSVVAGLDPLIVLAAILWWDARFANDPSTAVANAWWTALMVPVGPLAVAVAAAIAARPVRRSWYGWGGSIVAVGVFVARWKTQIGLSSSITFSAVGVAIAAALESKATGFLALLARRLASTPLAPVVVGTCRTPLHHLDDDDFDSFP